MAIDFNTADYNNVRAAIDVSLTTDDLADEVIALDVFKAEAVAIIEDAASALTDEQKTQYAGDIKRAAVLMTAAFVAPKIVQLTSETIEGDKFTFAARDLASLSDDLQRKAFAVIGRIIKQVSDAPDEIDVSFIGALFSTAKCNPR